LKFGTRNPVLYEARVRNVEVGAYRRVTFGFVVEPKPVYSSMRPARLTSSPLRIGTWNSMKAALIRRLTVPLVASALSKGALKISASDEERLARLSPEKRKLSSR